MRLVAALEPAAVEALLATEGDVVRDLCIEGGQ